MIGDDVVTDTGGAMKAGMQGILVKTGKFSPELPCYGRPRTHGSYRFNCGNRHNSMNPAAGVFITERGITGIIGGSGGRP